MVSEPSDEVEEDGIRSWHQWLGDEVSWWWRDGVQATSGSKSRSDADVWLSVVDVVVISQQQISLGTDIGTPRPTSACPDTSGRWWKGPGYVCGVRSTTRCRLYRPAWAQPLGRRREGSKQRCRRHLGWCVTVRLQNCCRFVDVEDFFHRRWWQDFGATLSHVVRLRRRWRSRHGQSAVVVAVVYSRLLSTFVFSSQLTAIYDVGYSADLVHRHLQVQLHHILIKAGLSVLPLSFISFVTITINPGRASAAAPGKSISEFGSIGWTWKIHSDILPPP